jgi:hypothetical protein
LHHILRLAFSKTLFDVQQYQFIGQFGPGNVIGTGSSYGSGTYYGNFHTI